MTDTEKLEAIREKLTDFFEWYDRELQKGTIEKSEHEECLREKLFLLSEIDRLTKENVQLVSGMEGLNKLNIDEVALNGKLIKEIDRLKKENEARYHIGIKQKDEMAALRKIADLTRRHLRDRCRESIDDLWAALKSWEEMKK